MRKLTLLIAMFIMAPQVVEAKDFAETMKNTLSEFSTCENEHDFVNLGNKFDRIAKAEKKEWLPAYYHAHCYIIASFISTGNAEKKDNYLDAAETSITALEKSHPQEVEVHVLKALLYTARLVVDPANRGQRYSQVSGQAIGTAMGIDPSNLRAQYMNVSNQVGQAEFFGQDIAPYCEKAKLLDKQFDAQELKSDIHPSWGKRDVQRIIAKCK
jgi:hypothetical protein